MKLYYATGACSLASHLVLEEAGARYEAVKVSLREGEQRRPEYLKINPKGKVPVLVLDDGQVLTENPVIQTYVADLHPKAGLLAPPATLERTRTLEWTAWCASGVQPAIGLHFAIERLVEGEAAQAAFREKVKVGAEAQLALFDRWLEGKKYVLGDKFSVADSYTLVFYHWATFLKLNIGAAHRAAAKTLLARPAVQRVLADEGLKLEA
ncbi:MAG TPA: glutathione S-transferase N-terminal domain-containing protein [Polyangia bacterium]|nr:glutathione S-transferase N-terminal domain-containing protein [Polyangia bacterium]